MAKYFRNINCKVTFKDVKTIAALEYLEANAPGGLNKQKVCKAALRREAKIVRKRLAKAREAAA